MRVADHDRCKPTFVSARFKQIELCLDAVPGQSHTALVIARRVHSWRRKVRERWIHNRTINIVGADPFSQLVGGPELGWCR